MLGEKVIDLLSEYLEMKLRNLSNIFLAEMCFSTGEKFYGNEIVGDVMVNLLSCNTPQTYTGRKVNSLSEDIAKQKSLVDCRSMLR